MHHPLSEGSLQKILDGEEVKCPLIFQILDTRALFNVSKVDNSERYRLKISDGRTAYSFVLLVPSMNKWIHSKLLTEFSIIRVNKYSTKKIKHNGDDAVVILLTNLEVLVAGTQVNRIVGDVDMTFLEEKMQLIDIDN